MIGFALGFFIAWSIFTLLSLLITASCGECECERQERLLQEAEQLLKRQQEREMNAEPSDSRPL